MSKNILSDADFQWAANELGVVVPAIKAVSAVESRGAGFLTTGEPTILYERHIMYRLLKAKFGKNPEVNSVVDSKAGGYLGGIAEHRRLQLAVEIDRDCALQSCSWGKFQIMGFHWQALGYKSVQDFINSMYRSERDHLDAFVRFIKNDARLTRALVALDWTTFARIYNGPAFEKNRYDVKMADEYRKNGGK